MRHKPIKPWTVWMLVCDGKPVTDGFKTPLIYSTRAQADAERCHSEWRIIKARITEVKR